jgi:hypothetical protein
MNHHPIKKAAAIFVFLFLTQASGLLAQEPQEKTDPEGKTSALTSLQASAAEPVSEWTVPQHSSPVAADIPLTKPASRPPDGSDSWHFEITPYLWAPQLEGNLRIRDTDVRVGASGGDLIKALDFALAFRVEAHKGKFGVFADENYVNLGTEGTRRNGNTLGVEPSMNIFEGGAIYAPVIIANKDTSSTEPLPPVFTLEILGGVRVFYLGLDLIPTNLSPVSGSRTIVDAFIGNRLSYRPVPKVTLSAKYSVGGGGSNLHGRRTRCSITGSGTTCRSPAVIRCSI